MALKALLTGGIGAFILEHMTDHQLVFDGKTRDLTLDDLRKFVESASGLTDADKLPISVDVRGRNVRKIWIDLSAKRA